MTTRVAILVLLAASCFAAPQHNRGSATQESAQSHCELNQEDYAVFTALLNGLHGPEDPEESWAGKEMLILDVIATPGEPEKPSGWGFRSTSNAAPSQETFRDYAEKAHQTCAVRPEFSDARAYEIIAQGEIDKLFGKGGGGGWKKFYKQHPKSAGFWQFSRPGYNSTRDEALLFVGHHCGWLCGTGHLYLLSKQDGQWTVKNRLMLWIS